MITFDGTHDSIQALRELGCDPVLIRCGDCDQPVVGVVSVMTTDPARAVGGVGGGLCGAPSASAMP